MTTKKKWIMWGIISGVGTLLWVSVLLWLWSPVLYTNVNNYEKYKNMLRLAEYNATEAVDEFLPDLEELEGHDNIEVYLYKSIKIDGDTFGLNLMVTYSDETYQEKKAEMLNNVDFITENVFSEDSCFSSFDKYEFQYKGFDIKIVNNEYFEYSFLFGMLGFNDETHQIAWLFYKDWDYDIYEEYTFDEWMDRVFRFEITDDDKIALARAKSNEKVPFLEYLS